MDEILGNILMEHGNRINKIYYYGNNM